MIQQGIDGLWGGGGNGVAICGLSLGGMVPLHTSAMERSPMLEHYIQVWADAGKELEVLEPRGWFTLAHKRGSFRWFLALATVDAAIDQFFDALHTTPNCFHVFAILIMTINIRGKQLLKAMNVYFFLVQKELFEITHSISHLDFLCIYI
jgi:hypothetical protein